jgi:hypothetical protein
LSDKMTEEPQERAIVFDYEASFTDSEKKLFEKIVEFQGDNDITIQELDAQFRLIIKANEILLRYGKCTLKNITLSIIGDPDSEIDEWFFNLHFYNFILDLLHCLQRVHTWNEKDKELFLKDLENNDVKNKYFRCPRVSDES